ncbi:DUF362 domain-containing protein [Occallatibacter riparius]|uniref:DUF362 domain-containing protein n=1 Tax=Occallatibacter riparius TaxID=1002689 RepID=A0A9J7BL54_9BACT|nr:DUF362 domain-containing protein [Occallatibacter riparius]UWZ83612.1 DUF362 domain-containing protein [Occallatibacter riparius]
MRLIPMTARRTFLKSCVGSLAFLATGEKIYPAEAVVSTAAEPPSRVVVARDPGLRGAGSSVDSGRLLRMLDRTMQALFRTERAAEAWTRMVRPGQRVALKVNSLGGRGISTNPLLVEAICERLQEAGVRATAIVVWDRDTRELERAGFRIAVGGNQVQCFGTDRVGYEDGLSSWGNVGSRVSKILTERCDVLINLPVLKDHDGAGVTIALKNLYGAIHNPNKYHPDGCNPYIADLNMLPEIHSRMRLTICDATTACFQGGPAYKPQYCWQENALIASQDPVALDTTGWQIIERKRAEHGLKTLEAENRGPRWLATAADPQHRLGTNDPRKIDRVEVALA